jgi:hypothetical protein
MAVIQCFLNLIVGETSAKNRVNPMVIKSVTKDNILTILVTYTMTVSARHIGPESLSLEINNNIAIPKAIGTDQKRDSSGNKSSTMFFVSMHGRSHISSTNTDYFLYLAHSNSKSNSWRITIHLEYFPPNNWCVRMCCIGLQSEITVFLCKRI